MNAEIRILFFLSARQYRSGIFIYREGKLFISDTIELHVYIAGVVLPYFLHMISGGNERWRRRTE